MNTKSLLTRIAMPVLGLGLLGGLGATLASSASAAAVPGTVTAVTHLNNHPDTTNVAIQGRTDNVWAYDNATEKFTIVPVVGEANTYLVTMDYVGSFHGFADPVYGTPLTSDGSVKGTIAYDVVAQPNQLPDPANLPGQVPSDTHIGQNIATLFDGNTVSINQHGDYSFSYQNGNYVQGSTITGDVTGH